MRLDKYLAETAQCTRSEAKALLAKGRVTVNGAVCKKGDTQLKAADAVAVDGRALDYQQFVYLMLNKPEGVVSASTDKRDTTVVDRSIDLIGDEDLQLCVAGLFQLDALQTLELGLALALLELLALALAALGELLLVALRGGLAAVLGVLGGGQIGSGAGKSTVIELISRFYDVQEGEVLIGGKNVKELDYDTILKNIAIVFQKTFLTRDSVLENIRMGSNATLEEVRAAAKEAQIDDFIMSLPDGYDTKVGSFGSRFSGGEKQRIAIARAILKNAPILILDEATSASDPENQMEIDKAIQNLCKGKTVIVVAHRLSALKMCNRVAVVENHTITSVGTHEEVRKNNAYYRKAWDDYETARNITYQLEGGEQHE